MFIIIPGIMQTAAQLRDGMDPQGLHWAPCRELQTAERRRGCAIGRGLSRSGLYFFAHEPSAAMFC